MTRQSVDRDHSDPIVHGIGSSAEGCSIEKPVPEGANVPECFLAEKNEEVGIVNGPGVPRDLSETPRDVRESWRLQPGPCEENAQGIDVIAKRSPTHQARLDGRRAASHEGIVDGVGPFCQALDEELGKLGLEAGAIAHFMNRM